MKNKIIIATSNKYDGNMGLHTGDNSSTVIENRRKFLSSLALDFANLICLNQTHSSNIQVASKVNAGAGAIDYGDALKDCDGVITNEKGVVLSIVTADCVPVLLYDETQGVVAGVHAGWRGTAESIVGKCVAKMQADFGCNPKNIKAHIGPSIGECCYEVGDETARLCGCGGKNKIDLKTINHEQLLLANVLRENIEVSQECTSCSNEKYFSYRADGSQTGRFMNIISLI